MVWKKFFYSHFNGPSERCTCESATELSRIRPFRLLQVTSEGTDGSSVEVRETAEMSSGYVR